MERPKTSAADTSRPRIAWAGSVLSITAAVGAAAKTLGVLVLPGMRGIASERAIEVTEFLSATFGYVFMALLIALVCGASFELARVRKIGIVSRGAVVATSGLIIALASPAVVQRIHTPAALALAFVASFIAVVAAANTLRVAHTRATAAVLGMLALAGVLRPIAWEMTTLAGERASLSLYHWGRGLATFAVAMQALAALLAAAWLGTRSRVRGRVLANAALVIAFALTYVAARDSGETPTTFEAILRGSLAQAAGLPIPYGLMTIAAFLVPATILLALVALVQRGQARIVIASLALALLSLGTFDVPLHALAITAAAQWLLLAMADDRSMWETLAPRSSSRAPRTPPTPAP